MQPHGTPRKQIILQALSPNFQEIQNEPGGHISSGERTVGWLHGEGTYTFPDGAYYKGGFHHDQMHGKGILTYPDGGFYSGIWEHGVCLRGDYTFSDGQKYIDKNWDYLQKDRALYKDGISSPREKNTIPGSYNVGYGIFVPEDGKIWNYDKTAVLRDTIGPQEITWIEKHCHKNI